jgi:hypothetical protein
MRAERARGQIAEWVHQHDEPEGEAEHQPERR